MSIKCMNSMRFMKKKIFKTVGIIFAILLAVGGLGTLIFFNYVGDEKYTEGKYKIQNCEEYPDAYIEVKGDTIQFHNINLNDLCRALEMEDYQWSIERGNREPFSEEDLARVSDFNRAFVDNPWTMKYDKDSKSGTFKYVDFCMIEDSLFGIVLHYDSFHKTIEVYYSGESIMFKK